MTTFCARRPTCAARWRRAARACSTRAPSWRRSRSAWQRFRASKRRWSAFVKPGSRIGSRSRACSCARSACFCLHSGAPRVIPRMSRDPEARGPDEPRVPLRQGDRGSARKGDPSALEWRLQNARHRAPANREGPGTGAGTRRRGCRPGAHRVGDAQERSPRGL